MKFPAPRHEKKDFKSIANFIYETGILAKTPRSTMKKKVTSWGKVADWYDELLQKEDGTYQKELILPNLLRLLELKKGEAVLDLACGQGFFSREFARAGANVTGVDISTELITIAKTKSPKGIMYHVASADNLSSLRSHSFDKAVIVLAFQNIENVQGTLVECRRVLQEHGKIFIVLNHPAFRIPKASSWGFDEKLKVQYRRIDSYISESQERIQMHPSVRATDDYTLSFHRPLQFYFKAFIKAGFAVTRLEEWNSHKESEAGPRAATENRARKEIPLFLFIEARNGKI